MILSKIKIKSLLKQNKILKDLLIKENNKFYNQKVNKKIK